jgi:hypothetical protein
MAGVQKRAERVAEAAADRRFDFLADNRRPQRIAARCERADHGVLDTGAHVEFCLILRLEEQAIELDHRHNGAALKSEHAVGNMARVGDVDRHRPLPAAFASKAKLFRNNAQHDHGP